MKLRALIGLLIFPALAFSQVQPFRYVGPLASWQGNPCNQQAGDMAFATDAAAGANLYFCTALNTWTQLTLATSRITGLAASATTDATNATNITTGTLDVARLGSLTSSDGAFFVAAPSACWFFPTTATTTTTVALIGASNTPVLNTTTNAAAGSVTLQCYLPVPTKLTAAKGVTVSDVLVFYGLQTSAATSINGAALSTITFPASGATETPSTVTPVAITGSITQSSTTGNLAITTAGAFVTSKLTLATPFAMTTDRQALILTLAFNNTVASVLTVNIPGLLVHYSNVLN